MRPCNENIFYAPETGLSVYIREAKGTRIHNNIIWGQTSGKSYGGLAIGTGVTDLEVRNNIILSINFKHMGATFNPAEHKIDYNLFGVVDTAQYTLAAHDTVADPQFKVIPFSANLAAHKTSTLVISDFYLKPTSPAIDTGTPLSGAAKADIEGVARPVDGDSDGSALWDRGCFEYVP